VIRGYNPVMWNSATKVHKFTSGNMLSEKIFCYGHFGLEWDTIAKHTKIDMLWVAGRNPTFVSHSEA